MINLEDYLRLEVEVPEALPNIVTNPTGEKGSWGWLSPTANTTISGDENGLVFATTVSQTPLRYTTELLPLAAGQFLAARFDVTQISANTGIRARFEYFDSSETGLASGAQTALITTTGTYYVAETTAPANTAFVKLRFDQYTGAGGTPAPIGSFTLQNVMVTHSDAGNPATVRTNLVTNPSFETNTTGWAATNATLSASAIHAQYGAQSLRIRHAATGFLYSETYTTSDPAVTGGLDYVFAVYVRDGAATNPCDVRLRITWKSATQSQEVKTSYVTLVNDTWRRINTTRTAPSWATSAELAIQLNGGDADGSYYVDGVLFEQASTVGDYFDGDTADTATVTYAWSGVAHESTSTSTTVGDTFEYNDPNGWQNILGPTHEIKVDRDTLDVGILTATLLDPDLDPTEFADLRPGKKVRLRALVGSEYQSLFEGKATKAEVTYIPHAVTGSDTVIQLEAVDAVAELANQGEPTGIEAIADLPYILEGKGVPWNVNGSGSQLAVTPQTVSKNENASVLDQVAITRDTQLGYAWLDRNGVLNVWDNTDISTAQVVEFTDVAADITNTPASYVGYSDINVGFSTDALINEVMVTFLRYDGDTLETKEVVYGPYQDTDSIATWGARRESFTIHGADELPAAIQTYATSILTANATPAVQARSLTMPVRNEDELAHAVNVDLYSKVSVVYDTKVDTTYRVTGISHQITPGRWTVDYAFDTVGSVASPQVTPSPKTASDEVATRISKLIVESSSDADTTAGNAPALRVGDIAGTHLRVDGNELLAMTDTDTQGTLHLNYGGQVNVGTASSVLIGNGDRVSAIAFGDDAVTTDASGIATITHGLGMTPVAVLITFRNNGTNHIATVTARTSTTFSFRVVNDAGANTASATRNVCWLAIA